MSNLDGNYEIPWSIPNSIPEGTRAVVYEIDSDGEKTGNLIHLSHEKYIREMGRKVQNLDDMTKDTGENNG